MFKQSQNLLNLLHEGEEGSGPLIFSYKSITTALYRSLTQLEQSIIIKLLSSPQVKLETLVTNDSKNRHFLEEAETRLIKTFKIIEKYKEDVHGYYQYKLNPNFSNSLKFFLTQGIQDIFVMQKSKIEKCINEASRFEEKLKIHAYNGWSNLYKYMLNKLNSRNTSEELTPNIRETMTTSSLMMTSKGTSDGQFFDFLLNSIRNQVSLFLYAYCKFLFKIKYRYLKDHDDNKEAVSEGSILNLLFNLTLLLPMMSFSLKESEEKLSSLQIPSKLVQDILIDLDSIGLIQVRVSKEKKVTSFAITPLIHNVLHGSSPLEKEFKHNIIIETDFKIYAYSHNMDYLESLLELFSVTRCKLPGVVICSLREERVMEAFKRGITPNQILKYLNTNAHYKVIEKKVQVMTEEELKEIEQTFAFIPENVVEQLFIWYRTMDKD